MTEEAKKQLIINLRVNASAMGLKEAYEVILHKMAECDTLDANLIARMSSKDKDEIVNRFMQENPEIMLACVHWKLNPESQPQVNQFPMQQKRQPRTINTINTR